MVRRWLGVVILLGLAALLGASADPWGDLRKGSYFQSVGDDEGARAVFAGLDASSLAQGDLLEFSTQLGQLGDHLAAAGKPDLARICYDKVLEIQPDAWPVVDRLIRLPDGFPLFPGFRPVVRQLRSIAAGFSPSFLLLNTVLNALYWSVLFLWFAFSLTVFRKYFRLAISDVTRWKKARPSTLTLLLFCAAFLFPLLFLGGWAYYPFLIVGVLYVFLEDGERRAVRFLLAAVVVGSILYSFNRTLERTVTTESFQTARSISLGKLLPDAQVGHLDDEVKTALAWACWHQKQPDRALQILRSTSAGFGSLLKYNLLAAIHLAGGRVEESVTAGKEALNLDEHDPAALRLFAQALRLKGDAAVLDSYAKRYPKLVDRSPGQPRAPRIELPVGFLWRQVLAPGDEGHPLGRIALRTLGEFFRLPVFWLLLMMAGIVVLLRSRFQFYGDSAYCSKCERIIHQNGVTKNLCEECYQLFLLKDPVFYDAKVIKENEIQKRQGRLLLGTLLVSLILPGQALLGQDKVVLRQILLLPFVVLGAVAVFGALRFATVPLLFHWLGLGAILLYLFINAYSVMGEYDGF